MTNNQPDPGAQGGKPVELSLTGFQRLKPDARAQAIAGTLAAMATLADARPRTNELLDLVQERGDEQAVRTLADATVDRMSDHERSGWLRQLWAALEYAKYPEQRIRIAPHVQKVVPMVPPDKIRSSFANDVIGFVVTRIDDPPAVAAAIAGFPGLALSEGIAKNISYRSTSYLAGRARTEWSSDKREQLLGILTRVLEARPDLASDSGTKREIVLMRKDHGDEPAVERFVTTFLPRQTQLDINQGGLKPPTKGLGS